MKAAPIVSAVAILSLALGIGANTAMFSILDSLLLRSLPVTRAAAPRNCGPTAQPGRRGPTRFGRPSATARSSSTAPSRGRARGSTSSQSGPTEFVDGVWASGRYFDVLGVPAILGRTWTADDDRRGGGPDGAVAVISYAFWQRRFGGAHDVIGRSLIVERVPFTIVGVTPPGFFGLDVGRTFDVAIPARHRAVDPRQGKLARSPLELVAERHRPTEGRPVARGGAGRRCAACSRKSAKPRCRRTGARTTSRTT